MGAAAEEEVVLAYAILVAPVVVVEESAGTYTAVRYSHTSRDGTPLALLHVPGHYQLLDPVQGSQATPAQPATQPRPTTPPSPPMSPGPPDSPTPNASHWLELHFDGGHRRATSLAGAGFVLDLCTDSSRQNMVLHAEFIGDTTNNVAEYTSLVKGLQYVVGMAAAKSLPKFVLKVFGDSKLVINQVRGDYACNAAHLRPLMTKARVGVARHFLG